MIDGADLFRLDGAVAIVTGATGWLGGPMVSALASAGATVYAVSRTPSKLDALAGRLAEDGLTIRTRPVDVASDAWPAFVSEVAEAHGRLDVLVNNAHVGHGGSLATATGELFDEAYELAVKAAWRGAEAARPGFAASVAAGGSPSVINVSSMYGVVAPDLAVYATEAGRTPPYYGAVKAALLQLTRYQAAELGPQGVRANAIVPGPFPAEAAQANTSFIADLGAHTLLRRIGRLDEIRTALLFLASPHSTFVTGSTVTVDGGWTAR